MFRRSLRARRRRSQPETAGLAVLVERLTGLTAAGAVVLVISVLGYVLARAVGGQALFLLVYAGIVLVVAAVATSRRKRRLDAERSTLPTRITTTTGPNDSSRYRRITGVT